MANYRIPKEISTELKINKVLYLFDFLLLIGILLATNFLKGFVHSVLVIPFYIFMGLVAIILIWRPSTNPGKRMYEVLMITLYKKKNTYCAIDIDQE